jgi:hypothetical protein
MMVLPFLLRPKNKSFFGNPCRILWQDGHIGTDVIQDRLSTSVNYRETEIPPGYETWHASHFHGVLLHQML